MNELDGHLAEIETNAKEYKGLIITGSGPKAFAAGADISEFDGLSEIQGRGMAENGAAIFDRIEQLPIVTIAAVNGFALGGVEQAREHFERGRLARAVRTEEADNLSLLDLEINFLHGFHVFVFALEEAFYCRDESAFAFWHLIRFAELFDENGF
jgi:hypothetical protein